MPKGHSILIVRCECNKSRKWRDKFFDIAFPGSNDLNNFNKKFRHLAVMWRQLQQLAKTKVEYPAKMRQ
jgi:hypothetical protein